jgi:hypothetical protein
LAVHHYFSQKKSVIILILLAVYAILILIISSVGAEVIPKRCEESCNRFLWQQHLETPLQGACVLVLLLGALLVYAIVSQI